MLIMQKYLKIFSLIIFISEANAGFVGATSEEVKQNNDLANYYNNYTYKHASVAQAKALHDDNKVILSGYIISRLSKKDRYLFHDESKKQIVVEIDHKKMPSRKFDSKTKLYLFGEIDRKHSGGNILDVDRVEFVDCAAESLQAKGDNKINK